MNRHDLAPKGSANEHMNPPKPPILELGELINDRPDLFEPIPAEAGAVEGWRDIGDNRIEIVECGEPLVNVADLDPPVFSTNDYRAKLENAGYSWGEHLRGAVMSQYARETAAYRLERAQKSLPYGYRLVVFDSWRSLETQMSAYNLCHESLKEKLWEQGVIPSGTLPDEVEELISLEAQNYISLPSPMPLSTNPTPESVASGKLRPSPHNTGGSIDVGVVRIDQDSVAQLEDIEEKIRNTESLVEKGKLRFRLAAIYRLHSTMLDFGTGFDFAGQESAVAALESPDNEGGEPQAWRRMLYNVMQKAGFEPYKEEWWHYNLGNQMAEATRRNTGREPQPARYAGIDLSPQQQEYEKLHDIVFQALIKAAENPDQFEMPKELLGSNPLLGVNVTGEDIIELSAQTGDPRTVRNLGDPHDMRYRGEIPQRLKEEINQALKRVD